MINRFHKMRVELAGDESLELEWAELSTATATLTTRGGGNEILVALTPNRAGELVHVLQTFLKSVEPPPCSDD